MAFIILIGVTVFMSILSVVYLSLIHILNPKFVLTSDTLRYNTESKIAVILGPSNIVSDNNHIYSERGFYNTMTEQAELLDRSVLTLSLIHI